MGDKKRNVLARALDYLFLTDAEEPQANPPKNATVQSMRQHVGEAEFERFALWVGLR